MLKIIIPLMISFAVVVAVMPFIIPLLRRLKFGQQILEEGPNWHKKKQGTPTMGGVAFIVAIAIAFAFVIRDMRALLVMLFALVCGIVGFVDDFIKKSSFTYYTQDALAAEAEKIGFFARREGLEAHARSATIRTKRP